MDSSPEVALWGHAGGKALFSRLAENSVEVPSAATEAMARLARELKGWRWW